MKKSLTFFLFFFLLGELSAQCSIEQLTFNSGTGTASNSTTTIGQSFKACDDGVIEAITVKVNFMGTAPIMSQLKIAKANTTNSNLLHTQVVSISDMGDVELQLNTPIAVKKDSTYSFSLGGDGDPLNISFSSSFGDTYDDGALFRNATVLSTADLFFIVGIGATPSAEQPIPTLSEWGLLILGLLTLNLSVFLIQSKVSNDKKIILSEL